ncbi:hypothetical protein P3T27_002122 [Kitasatospora sp. MAA19]|uniref:hypothetical protein n=1 Tax=unclassified Kitasatospora TaxID=2633591 RepID=UPI002473049E|nr:hypothetical protein [Kitasatospora sp. MAA19]MDH6705412.1 hypothetical protein [Kitasatospora sp. MAA19]
MIGPADLNGQIYDVHDALYKTVTDHDSSINRLKVNPVLHLGLAGTFQLAADSSSVVYWDTAHPITKVGAWDLSSTTDIKVPEAGVYRAHMSLGGWSTGSANAKVRGSLSGGGRSHGAIMYGMPGSDTYGDTTTTSFQMMATLNAGDAISANIVSWWQGFRSDLGPGYDRDVWSLQIEKISG